MTPLVDDLFFRVECWDMLGTVVVLYRHREKRHWWNSEWDQISYRWLLTDDAKDVALDLLEILREDEARAKHRADQLAKYGSMNPLRG